MQLGEEKSERIIHLEKLNEGSIERAKALIRIMLDTQYVVQKMDLGL